MSVRSSVRPSVRPFVCPSVRPSQSLIRYSSKTAKQNFMKLSGIVHYMMPYCTSYFKFFIWMILGFPRAKQGLCHYDVRGGGPSLIRYSSKTAEQNFMKLSGIVHYMMPYTAPPILNLSFYSNYFWMSQSKTRTLPYKTWGSGGYHFVSIAHSISSFFRNYDLFELRNFT